MLERHRPSSRRDIGADIEMAGVLLFAAMTMVPTILAFAFVSWIWRGVVGTGLVPRAAPPQRAEIGPSADGGLSR